MSQVPLAKPQVSMSSTGTLLGEPLSDRALWQRRIEKLSDFVLAGHLYLACVALSLVLISAVLLTTRLRTVRRRDDDLDSSKRKPEHFMPLGYALPQTVVSAAALALSLHSAFWRGPWQEPFALGYMAALGVARYLSKSRICRTTIYHHMNGLAAVATLLEAVKTFLPTTIIGSNYRPPTEDQFKLACLFGVLVVSFVSPRRLRNKKPNLESLVIDPGKESAPEETSSWFSYYVSYDWLTGIIIRGFFRDLCMGDLPPLPSYDAPLIYLGRVQRARAGGAKTLQMLLRVFKSNIRTIMAWSTTTAIVEYVAPFAMYHLLSYLETPDSGLSIVHPFVWISLLFIGPMTRSICYQRSILSSTRLLVRVKAAVIQEVYHRILWCRTDESLQAHTEKLLNTSMSGAPANARKGSHVSDSIKIESLVSYDADAISSAADIFYAVTASTVSTAMAMTFLYQILGWPSLVGVAVLGCLSPLPGLLSQRVSRLHRYVMEVTDARLSRISEYLHSIRTLKYFGWEDTTYKVIDQIRKTEQQRIWKRTMTSLLIAMTGDVLSFVSLITMFSTYVLFTNKPLRAPTAFTALAIMETLRAQFIWLSKVVQWVAQGRESLQRVDRFLESTVKRQKHPPGPPEFNDATFRVAPSSDFRLSNLAISFREGDLNVIIGPTGSGKTSLLLSLLGETILESGMVTCPQDVAYVPQTPWLQNDTVRQNILFYSEYDETRYSEIINACDLVDDLRQFPMGDLTPVGEQGSTLSGGQKQRVSLARALYSRSTTLLLDDIFSALDAHTASQVYKKCFCSGLLAGRTVIVVTHYATAIEDADMSITLDNGAVTSIKTGALQDQPMRGEDRWRSHEDEIMPDSALDSMASSQTEGYTPEIETPNAETNPVNQNTAQSEEHRASGRVPRSMIVKYMLLFDGVPGALLAVVSALVVQIAHFSVTFWLSIWTGRSNKDEYSSQATWYLLVYVCLVVTFMSLQMLNNFIYQRGSWKAAKTMHERLVNAVLQAPISWFDRTPVGRIINRFGLDVQSLDNFLVDWLRMTLDNILRFCLRLASIASIMPIFALPAGLICLVGFATGEVYTRAQISVKRLCSVKFSPVFAHFNDTLAGMAVIRARHLMDRAFQRQLADKVAVLMQAYDAQYNCNRWVSVRSDFCAATIAVTAGFIAYYQSGSAGLVGFSLTNAIGLSQTILTLVRNSNELEVELNSFQRISEYAAIEPEESPETTAELQKNNVPAAWPLTGAIEFQGMTARYAVDGPDVLRNIEFSIRPGERVAIIGRTGSGKSTLVLSLLRSAQVVSGRIVIDGIDLSTVPLRRLRQSISLIPQESVFFSGDVQSNLDPSGELGETELQSVLSACCLIQGHNTGDEPEGAALSAHTPVARGGRNFSNGQRQILGLARAMCRRSKVVILDEATASVDHKTDVRMQRLIRSEFADSTIITIAHRLRTVMDYDRVIVMGAGKILEIGSPADLIKSEGPFWDMLRNTGEFDELVALTKSNHS